jgi:hypothetical protein
MHVLREL